MRLCQIRDDIIFGMCLQPDPRRRSTFADIAVALQRVKDTVHVVARSSSAYEQATILNPDSFVRARISQRSEALSDVDGFSVVSES